MPDIEERVAEGETPGQADNREPLPMPEYPDIDMQMIPYITYGGDAHTDRMELRFSFHEIADWNTFVRALRSTASLTAQLAESQRSVEECVRLAKLGKLALETPIFPIPDDADWDYKVTQVCEGLTDEECANPALYTVWLGDDRSDHHFCVECMQLLLNPTPASEEEQDGN